MGVNIYLVDENGDREITFSDPYNETGLSHFLGFSWWGDIMPLLEDNHLPIEDAKKVKQMLLDKPITKEAVLSFLKKKEWDLGDCQSHEVRYVLQWKELLSILEESIERGIMLLCSL